MVNATASSEVGLFKVDLAGLPEPEEDAGYWIPIFAGAAIAWAIYDCQRQGRWPILIRRGNFFWYECR